MSGSNGDAEDVTEDQAAEDEADIELLRRLHEKWERGEGGK